MLMAAPGLLPGKVGPRDVQVRRASLLSGKIFLPFVFETYGLWGKQFQDFFAATMMEAEEYRGIPGAAISMYWRRRISVTLHKTMAEGILGRADA